MLPRSVSLFSGCEEYEYACNSTHCIDLIQRCDRIADCHDDSDEQNCGEYMYNTSRPQFLHPLPSRNAVNVRC